ncbi:RNA-guided endonuclease InsQ/TnpB family protein [Micromonospora inyonensis]|uniref:Helix-turn-helix domain-containing protein n=1 Tax=Micromonospora inyonensis TaxID=47866 RepID=A0A1C6SFQ9_9ACTN|nr:helix-turn-helix domain-containing protein [Micromonospora inyonensis]SCL28304.1 Helix-turn-helix domain-containing protein [Micromonospora inyonensis]
MSSRVVKRAYRFRFYPTDQQRELLNRTFGCVRYVYNRALAERSRAWTQEQRRVTFAETCRMLTVWKNEPDTAWLYEVSNVALQQSLQHLQQAYVNFWAKRATYPTFTSKRTSKASATFTTSGFSFRDGQITLAKTDEQSSMFPASRESDAARSSCGTFRPVTTCQ